MRRAKSEVFSNTTELVKFINKYNLSLEDIISVLTINDELFMIYYEG